MYNTGLVLESRELISSFDRLNLWNDECGFIKKNICTDIKNLYSFLKTNYFDLIIIENKIAETDDYRILKQIKSEGICRHIALCSINGDFETARTGILLGVDDFFILPLKKELVLSLFERIKIEDKKNHVDDQDLTQKLLVLFFRHDKSIVEFLEKSDIPATEIDKAVNEIFARYEWLDLYLNQEDFFISNFMYSEEQRKSFLTLFETHSLLYPEHNDALEEVINHILFYPESDIKRKSLSEELHINKSYLSTVFFAQTKLRFVDYITQVKLLRAAWLLRNTNMMVNEVAKRMAYKDMSYFSRQFKKTFGISPSEYKLPVGYNFVI